MYNNNNSNVDNKKGARRSFQMPMAGRRGGGGHQPQYHGWAKPPPTTRGAGGVRGGMTVTVHPGGGSSGGVVGGGGGGRGGHNNEASISTVTITQVRRNNSPMETKSAPSDREWDHRMDRGVANEGDDEDGFHFPSRISEEMLAADIRETTINCDDDHEDDEEYEDAKKRESARDSLIESVNEQLESIEELLHVQQSKGVGYKKFNEDKFTEARDRDRDDDDDDFSDVVSTRDAGTTPPPLSPSDHQLNENDTIDLPTIIPRSLSDDNLYYPSFSAGGGRGGGREEWERDLARFDLDFEGSSDEDDDLYRRDSTPPFPLRLHLGDGVDYDGRGNVNELSRWEMPCINPSS